MATKTEVITSEDFVNPSLSHIYITNVSNATFSYNLTLKNFTHWYEIPFVKYQIKETDMRRKTASFTTNWDIDLTEGLIAIKIVSPFHENFAGFILGKDYTQYNDATDAYSCQDMSRLYQSKTEIITQGDVTLYRLLKSLLTKCILSPTAKLTDNIKKEYKNIWSGLREMGMYQPSLFGNTIKTNMLSQAPRMVIKDTSIMDIILDICHANAYVDVYFSDDGVLQIEPISLEEWTNTGLILTDYAVRGESTFKFDTKNAITSVDIKSTSDDKVGTVYGSQALTGLNLAAFFGQVYGSADNPNKSTKSTTTATTSTNNSTKKTTTNKSSNPYKTKKKYLLIDGDGGETKSFLNEIAKHIRAAGWTVVVDGNIGPGAHSRNYKKVKNGCYMPVYNGLCAATIYEMPLSYYGGVIKKNGSVLCPAWDTHTWTSSRMKQYRNNISKISWLPRAHDDNFSNISGIKNPANYMSKNGIKYCVADSAKKIANQFLAGGWVAYNKK